MRPLLAHIYEPKRFQHGYVQYKYDGVRAIYQNGRFQSRDEHPFAAPLLDHLSKELQQRIHPDALLDGELYVHGWPLSRINGAVSTARSLPIEDTLQVQYHVFDAPCASRAFHERWDWAIRHIVGLKNTVLAKTQEIFSPTDADAFYTHAVEQGYEGIMYRLGTCPYTTPKQKNNDPASRLKYLSDQNNRCWHLLKRKDWQDDWFLCTDLEEGTGKCSGMMGALVLKASNGETFRVGSGFDDLTRKRLWETPTLIVDHFVHVRYRVLTSYGIPFNPTYLEHRHAF